MHNKVLDRKAFFELLTQDHGRLTNRDMSVVEDQITIDCAEHRLEDIHFENLTFSDMLSIRNTKGSTLGSIVINECCFQGGLNIEHLECRHLSIADSRAKWIQLGHVKADSACLQSLTVARSLDLSMLELTSHLRLAEVTYDELLLVHQSTYEVIKVPRVITDLPAAMVQFRLAGIPVFSSTQAARTILAMLDNSLALAGT